MKWYTRQLEVLVPKGVEVRLLSRAHRSRPVINIGRPMFIIGRVVPGAPRNKFALQIYYVVVAFPAVRITRHTTFMVIPKEVKSVLEQEKILKQQGNYVRIKNLLSKEIIAEGVHILNNVEKDFTNRGIDLNMPVEEKLQRYLQIKDIKNQKYLQTGRMLSKGVSVTYDSIFSNVFEIEDELTL